MKKFNKPEMEVVLLTAEDIMTTSCSAVAIGIAPDMGCGELEGCPTYDLNDPIFDDE